MRGQEVVDKNQRWHHLEKWSWDADKTVLGSKRSGRVDRSMLKYKDCRVTHSKEVQRC